MRLSAIAVRAAIVSAFIAAPLLAQDLPGRTELSRTDLTGAPSMEVVQSLTELKPGDILAAHSHHGVETVYVLEGGEIESAKGKSMLETGASSVNLRDAVHGGFTVVGGNTIKLLTVHVVDKNRPLYAWVNAVTSIGIDLDEDGVADVATMRQRAGRIEVSVAFGGSGRAASRVEFGIGSDVQQATCLAGATLTADSMDCASADSPGPQCDAKERKPALVLGGEDCDAIRVYWDSETATLGWWRR